MYAVANPGEDIAALRVIVTRGVAPLSSLDPCFLETHVRRHLDIATAEEIRQHGERGVAPKDLAYGYNVPINTIYDILFPTPSQRGIDPHKELQNS